MEHTLRITENHRSLAKNAPKLFWFPIKDIKIKVVVVYIKVHFAM